MKLKSLIISRGYDQNSPLKGSIEFFNDGGEMKITLSDEFITKVVALFAPEIVKRADELSNELTVDIINEVPLISPPRSYDNPPDTIREDLDDDIPF